MVKVSQDKLLDGFKVLLVYCNSPMESLVPLGLALLSGALRHQGAEVEIFDSTYYSGAVEEKTVREETLAVVPVDYSEIGIEAKDSQQLLPDFKQHLADFKPGLIGFSCSETNFFQVESLLTAFPNGSVPVIIGGAFATFEPEYVMRNPGIDMVCIGDGEEAICDVAHSLVSAGSLAGIANVWTRDVDGHPVPPVSKALVDIDAFPFFPDFSRFDPRTLYRPMSGRFYRMLPLAISRGCPYTCTFCSAPSYAKSFELEGAWLRSNSISKTMDLLEHMVDTYQVEYLYIISETFLAKPRSYRKEFYKEYGKRFRLPFWFSTRPETITEYDMKSCEDVGCHRISLGVEHGNTDFRKEVLGRNISNERILKAVDIISKTSIQFSVNNMLGFPGETRKLFFDTVELNRQIPSNNSTITIFQPFRGTPLYDVCVDKGYINSESL